MKTKFLDLIKGSFLKKCFQVGMGVYSGIPREAYDQLLDKSFGGQTVATLKLLSMTKKPTEEGRYFAEAEFNLAKMLQLGEDTTTDDEVEKESKHMEQVRNLQILSKYMALGMSQTKQIHLAIVFLRFTVKLFIKGAF